MRSELLLLPSRPRHSPLCKGGIRSLIALFTDNRTPIRTAQPAANANCVVGVAVMNAYNGRMTAHPYILLPTAVRVGALGLGRCPGPPPTTVMDVDL